MFARYHYLSHTHHKAAKVFLLFVNNQLAGFCSVIHFPHPRVKNFKRIHRVVLKPDFQGLGIGSFFSSWFAKYYKEHGYRMIITTTTPALIHSFKKSTVWKLTRQGRVKGESHSGLPHIVGSARRITTSWEYVGN